MKHDNRPLATATFAGGCFWCIESDFLKNEGVIEVVPGYTGGHKGNPTYEEVSSGLSGHLEAVQIVFNPEVISYSKLLDIFWKHIDPTDKGGQFVDRGSQYRTAIIYHDDEQKTLAESSRQALSQSGLFNKPIVTKIMPLQLFYPAEPYHQKYFKKNPIRYKFYRANSGRDQFLNSVWRNHEMPADDGKRSDTNKANVGDKYTT
jgi:peptide methionine sulfoxide reductase msrA/msrB